MVMTFDTKLQRHLPSSIQALLQEQRVSCDEKACRIRASYGSVENYRQTLILEVIVRPDDVRLEEFYRLYRSVFTLEDESEPIDGFRRVLGFNNDDGVQREFGPLIEPVFLLRDPETGRLVAAANFALYAYPEHRSDLLFDVSCQLHFLLVQKDFRSLGIATNLLRHVEDGMVEFGNRHCRGHRSFMTCEQNNPLRMTDEQIAVDATAALIDPYDRMAWWCRRGFRRLELPYIQPPLKPDLAQCNYLDYYVRLQIGPVGEGPVIPSAVLLEHLRRFFTVSVGKFVMDIDRDPDWRNIQTFLSERTQVAILPCHSDAAR